MCYAANSMLANAGLPRQWHCLLLSCNQRLHFKAVMSLAGPTAAQLRRGLAHSWRQQSNAVSVLGMAGGTYPSSGAWYYGPYGTFGMHNSSPSNARASPVNVGPFATALVKGDPPAKPYVDLRRPLYLCTPKKKSSLYPRPFLSTSIVCENLLPTSRRSVQRLGYIAVHKARPFAMCCAPSLPSLGVVQSKARLVLRP